MFRRKKTLEEKRLESIKRVLDIYLSAMRKIEQLDESKKNYITDEDKYKETMIIRYVSQTWDVRDVYQRTSLDIIKKLSLLVKEKSEFQKTKEEGEKIFAEIYYLLALSCEQLGCSKLDDESQKIFFESKNSFLAKCK